jgi:two-component system response regulator YesN
MSIKILVVDDDVNFCETFSDTLKEKGYDVDTALNGREALLKLKRADYKLVFVDMLMPVMDGTQLIAEIRKMKPEVASIGITGFDDYDLVRNAISSGASGCTYKPIDYDLIEKIIRKVSMRR